METLIHKLDNSRINILREAEEIVRKTRENNRMAKEALKALEKAKQDTKVWEKNAYAKYGFFLSKQGRF